MFLITLLYVISLQKISSVLFHEYFEFYFIFSNKIKKIRHILNIYLIIKCVYNGQVL